MSRSRSPLRVLFGLLASTLTAGCVVEHCEYTPDDVEQGTAPAAESADAAEAALAVESADAAAD